jgi:hypothetical protein
MAKKRGRENPYDMVLSLGAVSIAVVIVMAITWRPTEQAKQFVDYQGARDLAVATSNWPIYVPTSIPVGYQVTTARFESESYGATGDTRWYLGLTNETQEYISFWQSDGSGSQVIDAATNGANCSESEIIANVKWEKCFVEKPLTRAFVRTQGDLTFVVSGTAPWSELTKFTDTLVIAN